DSAQHCNQSTNLLGCAIYEVLHSLRSLWLIAGKQLAHVIAYARDSQQTGFLIQNRFHFFCRETETLKEIQHDPRIKRPRPSAHAESIQRSKAQGVVYTFAISQGTQAGTAAQMSDDNAPLGNLRCYLRQHRSNIFVGQAMEPISPQAGLADISGQWNQLSCHGATKVKTCIEACDLWDVRQPLEDCFNRCQVVGLMQRGKWNKFIQVRQDLPGYHHWLAIS